MDDLKFKQLIEKYQQGLLSGEEEALMEEWFEALAMKDQPARSKADKARLKHRILERLTESKEIILPANQQRTFPEGTFYTLKVAASVILLAALSYLIWQFTSTGQRKAIAAAETVPAKGVNKITLSDGSIVWLKGKSTLTYPEAFTSGERRVTLQGEGLFEVAKDSLHPFVIQCDELITTVLGTSFNIKASGNNIEVAVLTGKVSLTSKNDREGIILLPNEKALYSMRKKQIAKVPEILKKSETMEAAAGTEYLMHFEDTKMAEVIRRIEGKFNVKVEAADPQIGNCMITADFTGQTLARTLDMIAQALGFDYEMKDKTIILTGAGCASF